MSISRNAEMPDWLSDLSIGSSASNEAVVFPFLKILENSLYYPASGVDGRPVQYLSGFVHSFIYADYFYNAEMLDGSIRKEGFHGYRVALRKELRPDDLGIKEWASPRGRPSREGWIKPQFATWYIFQRELNAGPEHGPQRFSLLFLGAEGVAAYEELFLRNAIVPKVITIIQRGTGFGGNYTDFRNSDGLLASTMRQQTLPAYMVCGGRGLDYDQAWWPEDYPREVVRFQHARGNGMWGSKSVSRTGIVED